jgi:hypothetical protein
MTMPNHPAHDDAQLAALLRANDRELADDGFTERVMRRIDELEQRSTLDASTALARWQRNERSARRLRRWQTVGVLAGAAAGLVFALLPTLLGVPSTSPLQAPQQLALVLALAVAAWALVAPLFDRGA